MFVRLTRTMRLKAGWVVALTYLLCVLAPAASFAFADGTRLAPCLMDEGLMDEGHGGAVVGTYGVLVHEDGLGPSHHAHRMGADLVHAHPGPANDHHKAAGAPCCGMVCATALPATVAEIVKPSATTSIHDVENSPDVADNEPPQHYRPPIS